MNREDIKNWSNSNGLGYRSDLHEMYERLYLSAYNDGVSAERDRIKQANAPEIERINAHIKELEDAVKAARSACAKICEDHPTWTGRMCGEAIKAREQA